MKTRFNRWRRMIRLFALLLLFHLSGALVADAASEIKTIRIATPVWENLTHKDGTGLYFDLIRMVYEPRGIALDFEITPYKRAQVLIAKGKADALPAAYYDPNYEKNNIYPLYPMDTEVASVVYKKGAISDWQRQSSMKGKKVVSLRGYVYNEYLDVNVEYHEVDRREQAWEMMEIGRMDFYMDARGDLNAFLQNHKIDLARYAIQDVLHKKLYLWFGKNDRTRELVKIYDQRIPELSESGKLKALFEKYQLPMPRFVPRKTTESGQLK